MIVITEKKPLKNKGSHWTDYITDDTAYKKSLETLKSPPKTWEKYNLKSWDDLSEILKMETNELITAIKSKDTKGIKENIIHVSAVLMEMEHL